MVNFNLTDLKRKGTKSTGKACRGSMNLKFCLLKDTILSF